MATFKVNKAGDRRGANPASLAGLEKAREIRRTGESRGKAKPEEQPVASVAPLAMPKINLRDIEQYNIRIRNHLTQLNTDPSALIATTIGTLMAEMDAANGVLDKMWKWLDRFMDNPENDPRDTAKLLESLRKWTETLQAGALKIAEIQSRGIVAPSEHDPFDAYRQKSDATIPVEVTVTEKGGQGQEDE